MRANNTTYLQVVRVVELRRPERPVGVALLLGHTCHGDDLAGPADAAYRVVAVVDNKHTVLSGTHGRRPSKLGLLDGVAVLMPFDTAPPRDGGDLAGCDGDLADAVVFVVGNEQVFPVCRHGET